MKRSILLSLGWLLTVAMLYGFLALLEAYWNLMDWSPRLDYFSLGMLAGVALVQIPLWFLARARHGKRLRKVVGGICLCLLAVGLYCAPPEPRKEGLLGRQSSSAAWYRWGRAGILALPLALIWASSRRRSDEPGPSVAGSYPD